MICFLGTSHAPQTLAAAARAKGLAVTDNLHEADLIFVSEDTPTDAEGKRDLTPIRNLVLAAADGTDAPIVLTSQVPPGFCRALRISRLVHMAETLRIKDAEARALHPEQFILGVPDRYEYTLPIVLLRYCSAHEGARVQVMRYEEAEFAKIAINMFLASQVDTTNRLAGAAAKVGARWAPIAQVLATDKRIGPHAYLTPGRWQDSSHLLRDHVTLEAILAR